MSLIDHPSVPTPDVERWQRAGATLREHAPDVLTLVLAAFDAGQRSNVTAEPAAEVVRIANEEHERRCAREIAKLLDLDEETAADIVSDHRHIPDELFEILNPDEVERDAEAARDSQGERKRASQVAAAFCSADVFTLMLAAFDAGQRSAPPAAVRELGKQLLDLDTDAAARRVCALVRQLEQLGAVNPAGLAACVQLLDDLLARNVRPTASAAVALAYEEARHA